LGFGCDRLGKGGGAWGVGRRDVVGEFMAADSIE
jgi:hypothetical protein